MDNAQKQAFLEAAGVTSDSVYTFFAVFMFVAGLFWMVVLCWWLLRHLKYTDGIVNKFNEFAHVIFGGMVVLVMMLVLVGT